MHFWNSVYLFSLFLKNLCICSQWLSKTVVHWKHICLFGYILQNKSSCSGLSPATVTVHTDFEKLVYLFTPILKNWCIWSQWFSKTDVNWKQMGVHWKLSIQSNQSRGIFEIQCIYSHWFSKTCVSVHTDCQKLWYTENISVHTDVQKLIYTENKLVSTEN